MAQRALNILESMLPLLASQLIEVVLQHLCHPSVQHLPILGFRCKVALPHGIPRAVWHVLVRVGATVLHAGRAESDFRC